MGKGVDDPLSVLPVLSCVLFVYSLLLPQSRGNSSVPARHLVRKDDRVVQLLDTQQNHYVRRTC